MDDLHRHLPNQRPGPSPADGPPTARRPARANRSGWLLFAAAVSAIAAGMATGHGLLLAAGLVLAPVGMHLISTPSQADSRRVQDRSRTATGTAYRRDPSHRAGGRRPAAHAAARRPQRRAAPKAARVAVRHTRRISAGPRQQQRYATGMGPARKSAAGRGRTDGAVAQAGRSRQESARPIGRPGQRRRPPLVRLPAHPEVSRPTTVQPSPPMRILAWTLALKVSSDRACDVARRSRGRRRRALG